MIISTDAEKGVWKISTLIHYKKNSQGTSNKRVVPQSDKKASIKKFIANIILIMKDYMSYPKIKNKINISAFTTTMQNCAEDTIRKKKK